MAKKSENTCLVCGGTTLCKGCSIIALIAGLLFLLQDLGIWNFWNISWYTVGFLLLGGVYLLVPKK